MRNIVPRFTPENLDANQVLIDVIKKVAAEKNAALITTCGYRPEQGADLWENRIKRYCKHSKLQYIGMLSERDLGYKKIKFFLTNQSENDKIVIRREVLKKYGQK